MNDLQWVMEQLRTQRHDFMNYIQVIYGYIQLNRHEDALNYIKKINKKMMMLSQINNIENLEVIIIAQEIITLLNKSAIEWEVKYVDSYISNAQMSKNIYEYKKLYDFYKEKFQSTIKQLFNNEEVAINIVFYNEKPSIILINSPFNINNIKDIELKKLDDMLYVSSDEKIKAVILQMI